MLHVRVGLAQLNTTVGDLDGNLERIVAAYERAEDAGCDLVAFPELAITGYPPEDLVLRPGFVADTKATLTKLAARTGRCAAIVGFVDSGRDLHNAAAVCAHGAVLGTYRKRILPNYAVFDEARYFTPGDLTDPLELYVIAGVRVGVSICEDAWSPNGPIAAQAAGGAELVVNINASPYAMDKVHLREKMLATRAADASCALVYVNQVGGQDELIFDGASMVFDAEGELVARAPQFIEDLLVVDLDVDAIYRKRLLDPRGRETRAALPEVAVSEEQARPAGARRGGLAPLRDHAGEVYDALVLGLRDYTLKNGFRDVVLGLSGGIDSSLVAAIAADTPWTCSGPSASAAMAATSEESIPPDRPSTTSRKPFFNV